MRQEPIIIKNSNKIETKVFASIFEYEAYGQVKELVNFAPYINSKVRIMPDAHAGKGCTVGTTMTITDKITPNLTGVDIGCGMLTVQLDDIEIDFTKLDEVIKEFIPSGFNTHTKSKARFDFRRLRKACRKKADIIRASKSIGSLGGGNHFIEIGYDETMCKYYLIIHSGSRKLGADVCKFYQDKAFQNVNEMKKVKENLIKKLQAEGKTKDIQKELKKIKKPSARKDLAFLEGEDFNDYMNDMKVTQEYASLNRATMAAIIIEKMEFKEKGRFETIHNYIDIDNMILRKGAVSAQKGEMLLIPINMKDGSLVCIGKGNEDWNCSAPHGAGRLMSRSRAKAELSLEDFEESMEGIHSTSVMQSTLDEAPLAYKPMNAILKDIKDTVDVLFVLKPVYNYKAH